MKKKTKRKIKRSGVIITALVVTTTGLIPLVLKNDLFYSNWWGGLVFAPLAIFVGVFLLYLSIFKWKKMEKMK
ncbi:MAG: hypothetical protein SWH78_17245 [Thermodesulfobacteriota bacterium]|nr:hypothetical protein [Thermodesulfobacteriota bacterium]